MTCKKTGARLTKLGAVLNSAQCSPLMLRAATVILGMSATITDGKATSVGYPACCLVAIWHSFNSHVCHLSLKHF